MISDLPAFEAAYVVSDLHLGGIQGSQMFASSNQFSALMDSILDVKQGRTLFVVNGDFIDFLAEPGSRDFNIQHSEAMLDSILSRPEFQPVLKSLQQFVGANETHLVINLGNHDLELALPATRRKLIRLLTDNQPHLEGSVELCFDGWGYRFSVNGKRALCLHGNESDGFNFTRYDELDRICRELAIFGRSDFATHWHPSAGSRFVVDTINPLKHRFPFVDLLKPEFPTAVVALCVFDPRVLSHVEHALRLKYSAMQRELTRPASQRRMLYTGFDAMQVQQGGSYHGTAVDIEEMTERAMQTDSLEELIREPFDIEMLGLDWFSPLRRIISQLGDLAIQTKDAIGLSVARSFRETHCRALQAAILPLLSDEPASHSRIDETDRLIDACAHASYDVVFAGHTHIRRFAQRQSGSGQYVNTGTWADLMTLTRSQAKMPDFQQVYEALLSDDRSQYAAHSLVRREATVGVMQSDSRETFVSLATAQGATLEILDTMQLT